MASHQYVPQVRQQLLSDDVLWLVGKHFLASPTDIMSLAVPSQTLYRMLEPETYIADVLLAKASAMEYSRGCCHLCYARHPKCVYLAGGGIIKAIRQKQHRVVKKFVAASLRFWPMYLSAINGSVGPFELAIRLNNFDIAEMLERAGSDPERASFTPSPLQPFVLLPFFSSSLISCICHLFIMLTYRLTSGFCNSSSLVRSGGCETPPTDLALRIIKRSQCIQGASQSSGIYRKAVVFFASRNGMHESAMEAFPRIPRSSWPLYDLGYPEDIKSRLKRFMHTPM